ncbi:MAG: hypothetical protein JXA95_14685 [Spirochaetales bacterium]|nr:hypothetical protein [Spirochaetales bacterium]
MKKIILSVLTAVFVLSFPLWAETYECVYLEGQAEYLKNSSWFSMDFGTLLESQTRIRLSEGASVQFDSTQTSLFFSRKGEYTLTGVKPRTALKQESVLDKLTQKINYLLVQQKSDATVAMGIRGSAMDDGDDLGFGTTSREDLDRAWQKIGRGEYAAAEKDLELYYDMSADPFSEGHLLFSLAYAEEMQGKTGEAWSHLGDIIMPERDDYYPSYLLLSGRLSLKSQNYEEAAASYRTFLEKYPDSEAADEARELLSLTQQ